MTFLTLSNFVILGTPTLKPIVLCLHDLVHYCCYEAGSVFIDIAESERFTFSTGTLLVMTRAANYYFKLSRGGRTESDFG